MHVCVQSVAGKAKPKKRQARSVPLGKSNLSNSSKGAPPVPGKAQSFQEPAILAARVPGAEGTEEAGAEAVPSLRFLTRHRRTEHPRHAPHPPDPRAIPIETQACYCLGVVPCRGEYFSSEYAGRAVSHPAHRQSMIVH